MKNMVIIGERINAEINKIHVDKNTDNAKVFYPNIIILEKSTSINLIPLNMEQFN